MPTPIFEEDPFWLKSSIGTETSPTLQEEDTDSIRQLIENGSHMAALSLIANSLNCDEETAMEILDGVL